MKKYFTATKGSSAVLNLAIPATDNLQTVITWLSMTNDKASTYATLWLSSTRLLVTTASPSGATNLFCAATTGIAATDIVIIQDVVDPTKYEIQTISSVSANVKFVTGANLVNSYSIGARIYLMNAVSATAVAKWKFDIGIATVEKQNASAVFVADKGQAIMISMDSVTTVGAMHCAGFQRDY